MVNALIRRLRALVTRNRLDDDLADEMRMHIEMRAQSLIDRGVDPDEARLEARRQFGNVTLKREEARSAWSLRGFDSIAQDLKYGIRLMRGSPVFAIVAIASIGVGIGASAAVFSLADAVLLKKLPVRAPDELVIFRWSSGPKPPAAGLRGNWISNADGMASTSFSPPAFEELRRSGSAAMELFGFSNLWGGANVAINGRADVVSGQVVSGNYFAALGITPAAGRLLVDGDDRDDAARVAVISHALWQRWFALSPDVIGMPMTVNGVAFTIVGVTPRGFNGTLEAGDSPGVTLPIAARTAIEHGNDWRSADVWWLLMMGRFNRGKTTAETLPALDGTFKQLTAAANPSLTPSELPRLELLPGARGQTDARDARTEVLRIMAWVAGILLLVASVNVASLMLVRGASRGREITMRLAIGASRSRVVRQFMTEAAIIGACGSVVGLLMAQWIASSLVATLAAGAEGFDLRVSWRVLAFASALGCLCSIAFGIAPAVRNEREAVRRAGRCRYTKHDCITAPYSFRWRPCRRPGRALGHARESRWLAVVFRVESSARESWFRRVERAHLHRQPVTQWLRRTTSSIALRVSGRSTRSAARCPLRDVLGVAAHRIGRLDHRRRSLGYTRVCANQRRAPKDRTRKRCLETCRRRSVLRDDGDAARSRPDVLDD
jgi:ABC-type antimicrobial peptide transport system permease subunit